MNSHFKTASLIAIGLTLMLPGAFGLSLGIKHALFHQTIPRQELDGLDVLQLCWGLGVSSACLGYYNRWSKVPLIAYLTLLVRWLAVAAVIYAFYDLFAGLNPNQNDRIVGLIIMATLYFGLPLVLTFLPDFRLWKVPR